MGARPSSFALTRAGKFRLYSTQELLRLPAPTWLIDNIIPAGGLVGLYGPPGEGKSFVAVDMALSVASGRPWMGHEVERGLVLYVAAEGGTGIGKRVAAWLSYTEKEPNDAQVAWLMDSIPINLDNDDMDILVDRIGEIDEHPSLVIIDTLARCFDGDENTQVDMGRFVQGVDKLRHQFQATVMVVHHTRLDGTRERGNTAFRGAADTMISVSKVKERIKLQNNKQKDSVEFPDIELVLSPIEFTDSAVVTPKTRLRVDVEKALIGVLADPWLKTDSARAVKLARLSGRGVEACRSVIRRWRKDND